MNRYICIHGHFYQPPRENPWLETVEQQESAYPFHDWNERITAECYGPNAWARILDDEDFITQIVSNYARISFNFGPTLLAWMERARPDVYQAIIAADGASQRRFAGHGSAMAQAYNHSILPLCNERDRRTQILWGIRDFERRFGRQPAGMWLPETAVDEPTLQVLAAEGVDFVLLAPHQAAEVRPRGHEDWTDVSGGRVNPRQAYVADLGGGRSINLMFYDGPVSQAVAFERLLESGDRFADRLLRAFAEGGDHEAQLVHIATDGETYGHHHRHGDMALAYALHRIENDESVELINYPAFLERHPPTLEAKVAASTSWSCAHGVGRWKEDCGCSTGGKPEWNQSWRAPLRTSLNWLSDRLAEIFEDRAADVLSDPWAARDDYIDLVLSRDDATVDRFLQTHGVGELGPAQRTYALKLLELQRHAMLMFTSCGWFFDDVSGIETTQIIRYAARAIDLASEVCDLEIESGFLEQLGDARSNLTSEGTGRTLYEKSAAPLLVDLPKLVAHYAVSSLFKGYEERSEVFAYSVEQQDYQAATLGRSRLALGRVRVISRITRESATLSFGFVHLGDHNISGGVREFKGDDDYGEMVEAVRGGFRRADMPEVLRLLDKHFGELSYSMRSLFRDEQQRALDIVVDSATTDAQTVSTQLYEKHSPLLRYLATLDLPLPKALAGLADFVLNTMLRSELGRPELVPRRIRELVREADALGTDLDRVGLSYSLEQAVQAAVGRWVESPEQPNRLARVAAAVELALELPFEVDLSVAQNEFYALMETTLPHVLEQEARGDALSGKWRGLFEQLGARLRIRVHPGRGGAPLE